MHPIIFTILLAICAILEIVGIILVMSVYNSICVQAHEVSSLFFFFIAFAFTPIVPDLVYTMLSFIMKKLGTDPLAVVYHFFMFILCLGSAIMLLIGLTFCGNPAQDTLFLGGILVLVAGIGHLVLAVTGHLRMSRDDKYGRTRAPPANA